MTIPGRTDSRAPRILFYSLPATGHLLALLGLIRAAQAAGCPTALVSHREVASRVPDVDFRPAGPSQKEALDEVVRRGFPPLGAPGPGAVEAFAGSTVDLGYVETLQRVREFSADLIISGSFSFLGPLVAAATETAWASCAVWGEMRRELLEALDARMARQFTDRGLVATQRVALLDPYPELLHAVDRDWRPAPDRIAMQPVTNADAGSALPRGSSRPTALITLGTRVKNPTMLARAIDSALDAGFDAVVTETADALTESFDPRRVRLVGFVPLASLLAAVDAVVTVGGTGTTLAALAAGLPLVVHPVEADQPNNARRVTARGLGVAIADAAGVGSALRLVIDDPSYAAAAREAATEMARLDTPGTALARVVARLPR